MTAINTTKLLPTPPFLLQGQSASTKKPIDSPPLILDARLGTALSRPMLLQVTSGTRPSLLPLVLVETRLAEGRRVYRITEWRRPVHGRSMVDGLALRRMNGSRGAKKIELDNRPYFSIWPL
jgi:hypothetical protein